MSVQEIRLFGDPVLRMPAQPVVDFDKELRTLVKDLTETMMDAPGAGLAAPQIGVSLRVFTYWVDDEPGHLVNPDLDLSEELMDGEEGCLSLPDLVFDTPRARAVVAKGMNMHGEPVVIEGSNLLARAVQHETDHLDGILFIENVGNLVCPAGFDLGEAHKVVIASVTEGEDKPLKYPNMFAASSLMLVSKVDLLPHLDFDVDVLIANARRVNPSIAIIRVSATTGEGIDRWLRWMSAARDMAVASA